MIDGHTYRLSEALARRQIHSWELAQIHHVAFEHQAFPRNIQSAQDLTQILNIMQENRFDGYVLEWNGLSEEDIQILVDALVDYLFMCRRYFPTSPIKLPLSTMLSSYSIYKKLVGYNPNFEHVLEIGAGGGNTMFFFKNHISLKDYSLIEACEAYYLLQSYVASYNFDSQFEERAFPQEQGFAQHTFTECTELEVPRYMDINFKPRAFHYPWWRIGEVAEKRQHYDLVTSNANLMEFSERALLDYLCLVKQCMKPQGVMICQCLGGSIARNTQQLIAYMKHEGFGALCISSTTLPMTLRNGHVKYTCVRNAMFVIEGHPLYDDAVNNMHYEYPFADDHYEPVFNTLYDSDTDRNMIRAEDIEQRVALSFSQRVECYAADNL